MKKGGRRAAGSEIVESDMAEKGRERERTG